MFAKSNTCTKTKRYVYGNTQGKIEHDLWPQHTKTNDMLKWKFHSLGKKIELSSGKQLSEGGNQSV